MFFGVGDCVFKDSVDCVVVFREVCLVSLCLGECAGTNTGICLGCCADVPVYLCGELCALL